MNRRIIGTALPVLEFQLQPGERIVDGFRRTLLDYPLD
jgi:hypothetical protein